MKIHTFINKTFKSNCYIVSQEEENSGAVVIDPGLNDGGELLLFLEEHALIPEYILITHEHFDHVGGVELIRERYGAELVASGLCEPLLADPKKNLSKYVVDEGFSVKAPDITLESIGYMLCWRDVCFNFIHTPGHSPCSIVISFDKFLFSGDLMINGLKTVTRNPGGDKALLKKSLDLIQNTFASDTVVYPGHGECFVLGDFSFSKALG